MKICLALIPFLIRTNMKQIVGRDNLLCSIRAVTLLIRTSKGITNAPLALMLSVPNENAVGFGRNGGSLIFIVLYGQTLCISDDCLIKCL